MEAKKSNACNLDFTLLKKLEGMEKIKVNPYKNEYKTIRVKRFVEQNFENSLYNYQHGKDFIYGLEEKDLNPFLNDDKAEYLFIYKFGTSEQRIFKFTEEEILDFAGIRCRRANPLIGFILYQKLCEHPQNYYINMVNNIIERAGHVRSEKGKKKKSKDNSGVQLTFFDLEDVI